MIFKTNKSNNLEILKILNTDGLVLVDGIETEDDFIRLSKNLGKIHIHPHSSKNGITYISTRNNREKRFVDSGFSTKKLVFHTDRGTSRSIPPKYMMLHCNSKAYFGGENILSDGYHLIYFLKKNNINLYNYLVNNNESVYFSGEEIYSRSIISEYESQFILRLYFDKRVNKTSYYYKKMSYLYRILQENSFKILLSEKQTLIVNNWRWVHAREAFQGGREMWRLLV